MLLELLYQEGFAGTYSFIYLPIKLKKRLSFGYAFVQLIGEKEALRFYNHFECLDTCAAEAPNGQSLKVEWSRGAQTLEQQVDLYRNNPLMHTSVEDEMKPIILQNGVRVPFPSPTVQFSPPAHRKRSGRVLNSFLRCADNTPRIQATPAS